MQIKYLCAQDITAYLNLYTYFIHYGYEMLYACEHLGERAHFQTLLQPSREWYTYR